MLWVCLRLSTPQVFAAFGPEGDWRGDDRYQRGKRQDGNWPDIETGKLPVATVSATRAKHWALFRMCQAPRMTTTIVKEASAALGIASLAAF